MTKLSSLLSSALIAAGVLLSQVSVASESICPDVQRGTRLKTVALFDGPPSKKTTLKPDHTNKSKKNIRLEWDVAHVFREGRHLEVECSYGPKIPPVIVKPPSSAKKCVFVSKQDEKPSLTCGK
ncbi:MAG: hypothetical protein FWD77_07695 [Betaproteobacteria bacterium]|nr:hypothetical protein [Betaproteobacteria bacterium]